MALVSIGKTTHTIRYMSSKVLSRKKMVSSSKVDMLFFKDECRTSICMNGIYEPRENKNIHCFRRF